LIEEINDCVGKGHFIKRKELLEKVSKIAGEIRAIETPISETDLEQQTHNPDWVDIENERHNLDLPKISFEENNENIQRAREQDYFHTIDIAQKREEEDEKTKKLTEPPTPQTGKDKDSKRNSILQKIEEKKRLRNRTKAMSGAPRSEGGISCEKANITIQLYNMDISNLEDELRKLESEQTNNGINSSSNNNWSLGDRIFFFIALIIFIAIILYFLNKG
jgi:hypothetical protein